MTDMNRMAEYANKNVKNGGTASITFVDHEDLSYYAEFTDVAVSDEDENTDVTAASNETDNEEVSDDAVVESTNSGEILSMVYTYFELDPESDASYEDYDEDSEGGSITLNFKALKNKIQAFLNDDMGDDSGESIIDIETEDGVLYKDLISTIRQYYYASHVITAETEGSVAIETVTYETQFNEATGDYEELPVKQTSYIDNSVTNVKFTYETWYFPEIFEQIEGKTSNQSRKLNETPFNGYSTTGNYGQIADEQGMYVALRAAGFTHAGACGIMGNANQESGLDPEAWDYKYNSGGGLVGWEITEKSDGQYQKMQAYCSENGYDYLSLTGQVNYLIVHLNENYANGPNSLVELLKTSDNVAECAEVFCAYYEQCTISDMENYYKLRNTYYGDPAYNPKYHFKDEYPGYYYYSEGISASDNYQDMAKRVSYAEEYAEKYDSIKDSWEDYINVGANDICELAIQIVNTPGVKYVWGAKGPLLFDCSGFVWYVYNQTGHTYNYMSTDNLASVAIQGGNGNFIAIDYNGASWDGWEPGDIIVKRNWNLDTGHTGIYLGNGEVAEAHSSDAGLIISQNATPTDFSSSHPSGYHLRWRY